MNRNALLVIDVQNSFLANEPRWKTRNNPAFETNVSALIDAFRKAEEPVVFFMDNDDDGPFSAVSPYYKLMEWMSPPKASEPLYHKFSRNCFTTTPLHWYLERSGVRTVTIAGIRTEQCCETTARVASDLGYCVDFVTEATLTFPILPAAGLQGLSADAITERTEYALRGRFASIKTVEEVVDGLPK